LDDDVPAGSTRFYGGDDRAELPVRAPQAVEDLALQFRAFGRGGAVVGERRGVAVAGVCALG
jgi:hypothetical protein